ncbi:polymorphic toxin-type HINT domain-containing protein [Actinoplanes sp. G11-F43]|uniref:polymorphic toxin-type HINT domain-containing protein n=1 Tax=Actinoplanes sp. G11-F43 TaxID=3424130 RepID=UPI003D327075
MLAAFIVLMLLAGFLHGKPVRADEIESATVSRGTVVNAWLSGGPHVRALAEAALTGNDDQVSAFFNGGMEQATRVDLREAVADSILVAGPALRAAAEAAIAAHDAGDPEALNTFLASGRQGPQNIDARLRVNQLMATGGPQVREAAQAVLDSEDPLLIADFVESGWEKQWQTDLRLRVNQVAASGGAQVKAAAQKALDAATPTAYEQFLSYDWDVAVAQEQETAALEDLLSLAEESAAIVDRETANAKDQAKRGSDAAAAAKRSADEAGAAAKRAQANSAEAKSHAKRAARAARQAAAAAQVALDAAAGAYRASQQAISAANRAHWAAGKAADATSKAYRLANQSLTDSSKVDAAKVAATEALRIANSTEELAQRAQQAANTLALLQSAIIDFDAATYNAEAAGAASDEAQKYADLTGAAKAEAEAAAAQARAEAARARRAMAAAKKYMQVAIDNAVASRNAALEAVVNARAAAKAAEDAVKFSGTAAEAAVKATEHANAAVTAANKVVDLGKRALEVYNAAREADAERLAVAKDAALETARELNLKYEAVKKVAAWDAQQAGKRDAETNRLLALAQNPQTDQAAAVTAARTAAITIAQGPGTWTRQAALDALSADENYEVLGFARSHLAAAAAQDDRLAVAQIAASENIALSRAAITALNGTDAQVTQFLNTQNYTGRFAQDRLQVNQILSTAKAVGRVNTVQRAQAALDAETLPALRDFLANGQYVAAAIDDRLQANQMMANPDAGPEIKAAAQVALDGPPAQLTQFLKVGQFQALERDHANTLHLANVAGLMERINQAGATAVQQAETAMSEAEKARGNATEAARHAQLAITYGKKASDAAVAAVGWANKAAASADSAVKSAKTAQTAAMKANASARTAIRAAAWADALHEQAKTNAAGARKAYLQAAKAAEEAGADIGAIQDAADSAKAKWRQGVSKQAAICYETEGNELSKRIDNWLNQRDTIADNCLKNAIADPDELAVRAAGNAAQCKILYPQGDTNRDYLGCVNSVFDPSFDYMQVLQFVGKVSLGIGAMLVPGIVVGGVGCLLLVGCGAALGALITIGDVGTTLYSLIQGDITFGEALKELGVNIVEGLVFSGAVKLTAATFRGLKTVIQAENSAKRVVEQLDRAEFIQISTEVTISCLGVGRNSFSADTPVLLDGGKRKPIGQIRIGDRVVATDPVFGFTAAKPVTNLIASTDTDLTDLTIRQSDGSTTVLHTTAHHPFWSPSTRSWVNAGDLAANAELATSGGGRATVSAVNVFTSRQTMYNFTVADLHTYYVLSGNEWILVHNAPKCGRVAPSHAYRGGVYKELKVPDPANPGNLIVVPGGEVNHMPPKDSLMKAFGLTESQAVENGIAIEMDEADHYLTITWGSRTASKYWRERQVELIKSGRFDLALRIDVFFIKQQWPGKYDAAIDQMLNEGVPKFVDYLKKLGKL